MNTLKTAQLIFGNDTVKARDDLRQMLAAVGVAVDIEDMPLSQIGKVEEGSTLFAKSMFYVDETHIIALSVDDISIYREDDGGSTTEIAGYEWLLAKPGVPGFIKNNYASDGWHAFGKDRAGAAFREALVTSGKTPEEAMGVYSTFLNLCEKHHLEWKALFGQTEAKAA